MVLPGEEGKLNVRMLAELKATPSHAPPDRQARLAGHSPGHRGPRRILLPALDTVQ
jgi:hypothetical protein